MNKIKFSYLWDKLRNPEFTTIRSWSLVKEEYYSKQIGNEFQVWITEDSYPFRPLKVLFHAWLKGMSVVVPEQLLSSTLETDVALNGIIQQDWLGKLKKMDKAILLVFAKQPVITQKTLEVS